MKILLAGPDVYVRSRTLVAFVIGGVGIVGASVVLLARLASMCRVLPVVAISCALVAALPWELRRTRFDARGKFARVAIELIVFAVLMLAAGVWCVLRSSLL